MATFSTNLALTLLNTGEGAGTWGNTTNTNLGTLLEQAISGYVTQAVATGTDTTLTIPNGATGVARNMYIELTGTGGTSTNLIVPANKKLYFIFNNSTGAVTVKVSGQTGVSVAAAEKKILVSNGTDIVEATSYISGAGGSLNITTLTATSANITTLTGTSMNVTTATHASANITQLQSTSATITTLTGTSANITTLTGTSMNVTTATHASANITTLTGTSANITTLTGTSMNVTTATHASANITQLQSTSATITTLTTTSASITNLTATSLALSNLSISSASITNISSTSLTVTNNASINGISVGKGKSSGLYNTVVGDTAGNALTTATETTLFGYRAGAGVTSSTGNTFFGANAGDAVTTGNYNTAIGNNAYPTGNYTNSIGIGLDAAVSGDNYCKIGDGNVDAYAKSFTNTSDSRDKADIQPTNLGLNFIMALQPRMYRWDMREFYKPERPAPGASQAELNAWREACKLSNLTHDGTHKRNRFHQGLIAQEVKAVINSMGVDFGGFRDCEVNGGDAQMGLEYTQFIAPLIKAIQELKAEFDEYKRTHP